jgi:hypothetical protein
MRRDNDLLHHGCDCRAAGKGFNWYALIAVGIVGIALSVMVAIATIGVS